MKIRCSVNVAISNVNGVNELYTSQPIMKPKRTVAFDIGFMSLKSVAIYAW